MERETHTKMVSVLGEVSFERQRQHGLWGAQDLDPIEWLSILSEEFGEVGREVVESHFKKRDVDPNYREELVQVAAVAVSAIESYDRSREGRGVAWGVRLSGRTHYDLTETTANALVKETRAMGHYAVAFRAPTI